jgi:hypothetical protein
MHFYSAYVCSFYDVSGQTIGPIFKGLAVHLDVLRSQVLLDCCTRKDGIERLSRNVGKQLPTYPA